MPEVPIINEEKIEQQIVEKVDMTGSRQGSGIMQTIWILTYEQSTQSTISWSP